MRFLIGFFLVAGLGWSGDSQTDSHCWWLAVVPDDHLRVAYKKREYVIELGVIKKTLEEI